MGKFKKGFFLGGLLGAGMMWLQTTTKGRAWRDELLDHGASVYNDVVEKIKKSKKFDKMTKKDFVKMVKEYVAEYSEKHELPSSLKSMVEKTVVAQWDTIKAHLGKKK